MKKTTEFKLPAIVSYFFIDRWHVFIDKNFSVFLFLLEFFTFPSVSTMNDYFL